MHQPGPYTLANTAGILAEVKSVMPSILNVIAGPIDGGHNFGVGVVLPDGQRHAVKGRGLDPVIIADQLLDWVAEHSD